MANIYITDTENVTKGNGVHHYVNQIIATAASDNTIHPYHFSRIPLFPDAQSGSYSLDLAGVYEILSEYYYRRPHPEYGYYELPYQQVYSYYSYNGASLQEIPLRAVPEALAKTPFCRKIITLTTSSDS